VQAAVPRAPPSVLYSSHRYVHQSASYRQLFVGDFYQPARNSRKGSGDHRGTLAQ
jgi:hypothetical protein